MATVSEVINRTASDLGLLRLGQALQAQDNTRITQAYDEVYDYLKEKGIAVWTTSGTVPDRLVPYVVSMMAENCLNTYSVSNDRYQRIMKAYENAEAMIHMLTTPDYASQDEPTDF